MVRLACAVGIVAWGLGCPCWFARADSWGPPTPEHRSANGQAVLRVEGGFAARLTLGAETLAGPEERWSIASPLGEAPVAAYIADDARHVVLRDRWGQVGEGTVLAFVGPDGRALRTYELDEFLTQSEVLEASRTISSCWWSDGGLFFFRAQNTQFAFVTQRGTIRAFDLATGNRLPLSDSDKEAIRQEAIARARDLMKPGKDSDPETGATIAGVLHDTESRARLEELLRDPSVGGTCEGGDVSGTEYPVQLAAGRALVNLLGPDALPLLEPRLQTDNLWMLDQWLSVAGETGVAHKGAVVEALAKHKNRTIRWSAVRAMVRDDQAEPVRRHREWLDDPEEGIRVAAITALALDPRAEDERYFRAGLQDRSDMVVLWAMRALTELEPEPADLDGILHRLADDKGFAYREDAVLALARRGDEPSLRRAVAWVGGKAPDLFSLWDACDVLAERRPPGAQEALRSLAERKAGYWAKVKAQGQEQEYEFQISSTQATLAIAYGALALMGETERLAELRRLAAEGEALDRSHAIEWLGKCKDRESISRLQEWARDEDPIISEEAVKALKAMGLQVAPKPTAQVAIPPLTGERPGPAGAIPMAIATGVSVLLPAGVWLLRRRKRP
ncbi:MAG: HEAT repeat domain-containing protein [Armatimonadetes bacterium]|nr:HEAT repeat domain-containing protein [Armatimonadota bacterium]